MATPACEVNSPASRRGAPPAPVHDGFHPTGNESRIGVFGRTGGDDDFRAGGDAIRYRVDVDSNDAPFTVTAELWLQPVAYRWAETLAAHDAFPVARAEHVVR